MHHLTPVVLLQARLIDAVQLIYVHSPLTRDYSIDAHVRAVVILGKAKDPRTARRAFLKFALMEDDTITLRLIQITRGREPRHVVTPLVGVRFTPQLLRTPKGKCIMQMLHEDQLTGKTLGKYRIEHPLGHGQLSAVYLARHESQEQPV